MTDFFEEHLSYLTEFLRKTILAERLSQSVILEGNDVLTQYSLALEIARILNCNEGGAENCNCRNCNWIRENKHPAVLTVSKIDNKNDESKTVISGEQVENILNTLVNPSDFFRVFIFCDADVKRLTTLEQKRVEKFNLSGFKTPLLKESETLLWYPSGLNETCFQSVAQNAMLKSIEEPPEKVMFIFLTENRFDLLPTIISRSQTFFVPSFERESYDTSFFKLALKDYPVFSTDYALIFAEKLAQYQADTQYKPEFILDCMQQYIKELIFANLNNNSFVKKAYSDIEKVEEYKSMIKAHIKEKIIYEDLAFHFITENG